MKKMTISVFLMLFCTLFISCHCQEQELDVFDNVFSSLLNIAKRYENEFSAKVNFSALTNTMHEIHPSEFDYKHTIENNIRQLYPLSMAARGAYKSCIDKMYDCCKSVDHLLNFIVIPTYEQDVIRNDKEFIWLFILGVLSQAQHSTSKSLKDFKLAQQIMTDLKNLLNATLSEVHTNLDQIAFNENQIQIDFSKEEFVKNQFLDEKIRTAMEIVAGYNVDLDFHEDEDSLNAYLKFSSSTKRVPAGIRSLMEDSSFPRRVQFISKLQDLRTQYRHYMSWYDLTQRT